MGQISQKEAPNNACMVIAGACSLDERNQHELLRIAQITVTNRYGKSQLGIAGLRGVGEKSRTTLSRDGKGMGIDYAANQRNLARLLAGDSIRSFEKPPSVSIMGEIYRRTGLLMATEVCSPLLQLPPLEEVIPENKLLAWNPSVNQLGWPLNEMGVIAERNEWFVGIKNGKSLGDRLEIGQDPELNIDTPLEQTWRGLASYTCLPPDRLFLIHRGVAEAGKGDFRNGLVHPVAERVKERIPGVRMLFDPSHSYGPKLKHLIVPETAKAMAIRMKDGSFLYDGVLVEAGTSETDTEQHITLEALADMCQKIARFRDLVSPTDINALVIRKGTDRQRKRDVQLKSYE